MPRKSILPNPNLVIAEYNALRTEILKRLEFRFQIINLLLVAAGTFLSIGVQAKVPASVLLVYPLLAFFLSVSWTHNGAIVMQLTHYIRENIESKTPELKWETYVAKKYSYGWLSKLSASGLILTTQVIAIVLALLKTTFTPIEIVLLGFSIAMVVSTTILLRFGVGIRKHK